MHHRQRIQLTNFNESASGRSVSCGKFSFAWQVNFRTTWKPFVVKRLYCFVLKIWLHCFQIASHISNPTKKKIFKYLQILFYRSRVFIHSFFYVSMHFIYFVCNMNNELLYFLMARLINYLKFHFTMMYWYSTKKRSNHSVIVHWRHLDRTSISCFVHGKYAR